LATEDLWFLRYCRSRVFKFVFFMQKLKAKTNKSCSIIDNGSNKIGLAFFRFFCDFLRNLQETAKQFLLLEFLFAPRPLEIIPPLQCGPWPWPAAREDQNPAAPVREVAEKGCGEEGELT
jgi:hypothetical protein